MFGELCSHLFLRGDDLVSADELEDVALRSGVGFGDDSFYTNIFKQQRSQLICLKALPHADDGCINLLQVLRPQGVFVGGV